MSDIEKSEENKDRGSLSLRRPFFIATCDEGYIWSEDVHSIRKDGEETRLRRRDLDYGMIEAPVEVVRSFFEERGYEFISEAEIKTRAEKQRKIEP